MDETNKPAAAPRAADKSPVDDGGCLSVCSTHQRVCHLVAGHHANHWCEGGSHAF